MTGGSLRGTVAPLQAIPFFLHEKSDMPSTTPDVFHDRNVGERQPSAFSFGGSTMTMLVPGAETDGTFSLVHIRKRADSSTPRHLHDTETEVSYVLEGRLGLETSGGVAHLDAHEWHVLPPRQTHRVFNDSPSEVRELLLCVPAIFDQLVATAGEPVAAFSDPRAITEDAIRAISTHAPNFGVRLFREAPDEPLNSREPAQVERLEAWGGQFEVLATLGDQDEAIALLRFTLQPGRTTPPATVAYRQAVYRVAGSMELFLDGSDWHAMTSAAAASVAPSARHALRNASDKEAAVVIVSTLGMVRLLRSIGDAVPARIPASALL